MQQDETLRRVWDELGPELAEQGYELIEVEYGQFGGRHVLRMFIDREGGVTIDDCARMSHLLSALLDKGNFIDERYTLEVSSPGFDRPLRRPKDFARYAGERIRLQVATPVGGRKRFRGVLKGISDGLITIEDDEGAHRVHVENIKKANLDR